VITALDALSTPSPNSLGHCGGCVVPKGIIISIPR
jgi:hypothetical protein